MNKPFSSNEQFRKSVLLQLKDIATQTNVIETELSLLSSQMNILFEERDSVRRDLNHCASDIKTIQRTIRSIQSANDRQEKSIEQTVQAIDEFKKDRACSICLEKERNTQLLPCRHISCCSTCMEDVIKTKANCPVCRTEVQSYVRIF